MTDVPKIGDEHEAGGHRLVLVDNARSPWQWKCRDCTKVADHLAFTVGLDGCPARPESLNYLSLEGRYRTGQPPQDPAELAREHWLDVARRIGLPVRAGDDPVGSFTPVYGDDQVCARFAWGESSYELRYNQPGTHGKHHIHAVKIEE